MNKPYKLNILKHISIAITLFIVGVVIGISLLFCKDPKYNNMTATVIMSFLAIAFSYYQFYQNKYETEKRENENKKLIEDKAEYDRIQARIRRSNDLKLLAYNDIMTHLDNLIFSLNNEFGKKVNASLHDNFDNKNVEFASGFLSIEFSYQSIKNRIKYYEGLLKIEIWINEFDEIHKIVDKLLNKEIYYYDYLLDMLSNKSKIDEHLLKYLIAIKTDD